MKRIVYLLLFISAFAVSTQAQVIIGSDDAPNGNAVLELRSDTLGFLPPRVQLTALDNPAPLKSHVRGIVVYNTKDDMPAGLFPGFYYNSGSKWLRFSSTSTSSPSEWFYMPSIVIDTSTPGTGLTKDLYQLYVDQMQTPRAVSPGAPSLLPFVPAKTDLYYYVLNYDAAVFANVTVSANGVMTYDIVAAASDATLINIVFVAK
jgi:hypothetical protein